MRTKQDNPPLMSYHTYRTKVKLGKPYNLYSLTCQNHSIQLTKTPSGKYIGKKGIPRDMINQIQSGQMGNQLRPKYKGIIGAQVLNKGVFRASQSVQFSSLFIPTDLMGNTKKIYKRISSLTDPILPPVVNVLNTHGVFNKNLNALEKKENEKPKAQFPNHTGYTKNLTTHTYMLMT